MNGGQLGLPLSPRYVWPAGLVCSFGVPMAQHHHGDRCPACDAAVADARRQFAAAVARGTFDAAGYTPAERKAQQRRQQEAA